IITASYNDVSDSIEITVTETELHNYTYSLSSASAPDTEIKINQSKNYTAQKYDNGVSIEQTFVFSVVGDISVYELNIIDGNNCSIKALKANYNITLKAVDDSDGSKFIEKNISLKSLF
ncbi:MAG: hypothetical protein M0Q94_10265, partial [Candidatus Cloacimonetes bacterium]|nr:hypothetical protein [Candidatus Cloacimonadota bacterium]